MSGEPRTARGASFLLLAASFVVVVAGLRAAEPILLPFLVAVFLAILSSPLMAWLIRCRFPRPLAVAVTLLANMAVLAIAALFIGGSLNALTGTIPRYRAALVERTESTLRWLEQRGIDIDSLLPANREGAEVVTPPRSTEQGAGGDLSPEDGEDRSRARELYDLVGFGAFLDLVRGTLIGLASLLSNALLVFLMMVFLLSEGGGLPAKIERAFGLEERGLVRLAKARQEVHRYLGIKTLICLVTGIAIGLWTWIHGVSFPLLWGLVAFLLNYIPSLGSIFAAIPAVLLVLLEVGPGKAIIVGIGYLLVNVSLGNLIEPHLMGRRFGLSTLVVFISLVFWGWLWGPVGMLLSVPLTMVLKIVLENTEDLRWIAVLLGPNPAGSPGSPTR